MIASTSNAGRIASKLSVIAPPSNGTVSTEPKDIVVKAQNRYGDTQPSQCVGKTVAGVAIFYQSKPGFVRTDSFRYRRSNPDVANDRFNMETYTVSRCSELTHFHSIFFTS